MLKLAEFGRALVTSGDLDPVYTMLNRARLERGLVQRWCLAYWIFYHVGVASRVAEAPPEQFWTLLRQGDTDHWPRGSERRHMRGQDFQRCVGGLEAKAVPPEALVRWVGTGSYAPVQASDSTFGAVTTRARTWRGFGPWIAFKIADMCDAVLGFPVDFTGSEKSFFSEPVLGAVWHDYETVTRNTLTGAEAKEFMARRGAKEVDRALRQTIAELGISLADLNCPHAERPLLLQEMETILCKWKSHRNGHYEIGHDTSAFKKALEGWGPLAQALQSYLP